jgi:hypothetical protein
MCFVGFVVALFGPAAASSSADPLSKKLDLDFYRDVPSRNLKGLATRPDGRLVSGPTLTELNPAIALPADLLWSLAPGAAPDRWLMGTGPDGRILEATLGPSDSPFTTRELAKLDEPHVFALRRLPDGSILVGTSPNGGLVLLRDEKVVARLGLPADSIFDLLVVSPATALVATGNPARRRGASSWRSKEAHMALRCTWLSPCLWPATMSPPQSTRSGFQAGISWTARSTSGR